jgi:hypothetical protein
MTARQIEALWLSTLAALAAGLFIIPALGAILWRFT